MKFLLSCLMLCGCTAAIAASAVTAAIPIPGPVRWDYVTVDADAHRVYLAHFSQVDVVDARTQKVVQQLAPTPGVHGVAVAADLGRVFTSDGSTGEMGVFDLKTGKALETVKVGQKPDSIAYDRGTHRVFTFNKKSEDVSVIDARTLKVLRASIPIGGSPEFAVDDGNGKIFFNVEDKGELAVLDAKTMTIVRHYSLAPCEEPSGLAMDPSHRLYSVCQNGMMVISDPEKGLVIGQAVIGHGPDGVAWMDGKAFSANGRDGTISVVAEVTPGQFKTVDTLTTAKGARTIGTDTGLHQIFTPTADFQADDAQASAHVKRPRAIDGTFHLLVVGPRVLSSKATQ